MEKVGPGIYIDSNELEDEIYTLYLRCPKGAISQEDAWYHYELIDREPSKHTIIIYTGYNPSLLTKSGYKVYTVQKDLLDLGKKTVRDFSGNTVPI